MAEPAAVQRTLILMRHAKSDYPMGVADHDRPLSERGRRQAALAGIWLRDFEIDAVLCSTATRTRETLARTGVHSPVTQLVDELYDSTPGITLAQINTVSDSVGTLLVVGHEPTTSNLALALADPASSNPDAANGIAMKFPTSALAVLRTSSSWSDLELGSATLTIFHVPR